jgi:hypothetical protein
MNKEKFANCVIDSILSNRDGFKLLFEKWFEQNPQEPVAVGLSDEQVADFMDTWNDSERYYAVGVYRDWAKTQTFTQPQQTEIFSQFERPKPPAPRVEVGQVWDFHGSSVEIVMVTKFQIVMKSIETGYLSIDDDIDGFLVKFEQVQL